MQGERGEWLTFSQVPRDHWFLMNGTDYQKTGTNRAFNENTEAVEEFRPAQRVFWLY